MSDIQLRQAILVTTRAVKSAYWDLAYAVGNLKVQQQSLDIARQSLQDNKSRVNIGTMAPIDIIEAQAEVARNEEAVIVAEAQITRAEDTLRALIFDPKNPDFWATRFELTEQPAFKAQAVDVDAAVKNALAKRHGPRTVAQEPRGDGHQHPLLPEPDAAGPERAGRLRRDRPGRHGVRLLPTRSRPCSSRRSDTAYTSVLSKMLGNDFHNWSFAVTVGYPIGRSSGGGGPRARQGLLLAVAAGTAHGRTAGRHAGARSGPPAEHEPEARGCDAARRASWRRRSSRRSRRSSPPACPPTSR